MSSYHGSSSTALGATSLLPKPEDLRRFPIVFMLFIPKFILKYSKIEIYSNKYGLPKIGDIQKTRHLTVFYFLLCPYVFIIIIHLFQLSAGKILNYVSLFQSFRFHPHGSIIVPTPSLRWPLTS